MTLLCDTALWRQSSCGLAVFDKLDLSWSASLSWVYGCHRHVNRPGISGGSNSEVDWSHDEQDNEQRMARPVCKRFFQDKP
jgi:hypothetical protein